MKIVNIMTCYNEIEYIPYTIAYYQSLGIEVFVLDNFSTDGSWEWLEKHDIPRRRVDTGDTFHMEILQNARLEWMHELKPDWVIYGDADEFLIGVNHPIDMIIKSLDTTEFNIIKTRLFEFYYTDEERPKGHPKDTFYYYEENRVDIGGITRIHKYHPEVVYQADIIFVPEPNICSVEGFDLNYGATKSIEQRKATMDRTRKAWQMGMLKIVITECRVHSHLPSLSGTIHRCLPLLN